MSEFAKRLIADSDDDDTLWRAGKTILDLEAELAQVNGNYTRLWNAVRGAIPGMGKMPYECDEGVGFFERMWPVQKAKLEQAAADEWEKQYKAQQAAKAGPEDKDA